MDEYLGTYSGLVEDNKDPEKRGRLKIRVPVVFGSSVNIGVDNLPWALPRGLPSGGTSNSGGIDWVPDVGDQVWVTFLDGEPEKPLWEWAVQSQPQAKAFQLHHYGKNGKPDRAAFTKYGHTIELSSGGMLLVTKNGNAFVLDDGVDGAIVQLNQDISLSAQDLTALLGGVSIQAVRPVYVQTDDGVAIQAKDVVANVDEDIILLTKGSFTSLVQGEKGTCMISVADGVVTLSNASGSVITMDADGNIAAASSNASIDLTDTAAEIKTNDGSVVILDKDGISMTGKKVVIKAQSIGLGEEAQSPVVLTDGLITYLNTHTHFNGNFGSPTGPPVVPAVPAMIGSKTALA